MMINLNPISKSTLYRRADVSWRRGERLLRELGLESCGVIGSVRVYPPQSVDQLIVAQAKSKAPKPQS